MTQGLVILIVAVGAFAVGRWVGHSYGYQSGYDDGKRDGNAAGIASGYASGSAAGYAACLQDLPPTPPLVAGVRYEQEQASN